MLAKVGIVLNPPRFRFHKSGQFTLARVIKRNITIMINKQDWVTSHPFGLKPQMVL
jgi:hypothetical protein